MKHLHLQIHAERYAELRKALGFKFRVRKEFCSEFHMSYASVALRWRST
jgi:hypothetical protein